MVKKEIDIEMSEIADIDDSEPRVYELGFHLDPELSSEEVKKEYESVRKFISEKGTIIAEGEPQMIQLAYTISRQDTSGRRDFNSSYFCWIVYEAIAENHSEVINSASENKKIVRFIDLVTTKDAARHSVEIREIAMKTPEKEKESDEETVGTDLDTVLENVAV